MTRETRTLTFTLHISVDEYQAYYSGSVQAVQVRADDGRSVRFPASALREHITHEGIHGRFALEFDVHNRLSNLRRLR